jgi:hypothetical protein
MRSRAPSSEAHFGEVLTRTSKLVVAAVREAPVGCYHGSVLCSTAALSCDNGFAPAHRWAPYSPGPIDNHDVMAEHVDVTRSAPAAEIARVLSKRWKPPRRK